jgi:hypothetical protein
MQGKLEQKHAGYFYITKSSELFWVRTFTKNRRPGNCTAAGHVRIKCTTLPRFRFPLHAISARLSPLYFPLTACNKSADTIEIFQR